MLGFDLLSGAGSLHLPAHFDPKRRSPTKSQFIQACVIVIPSRRLLLILVESFVGEPILRSQSHPDLDQTRVDHCQQPENSEHQYRYSPSRVKTD